MIAPLPDPIPTTPARQWDIFCRVIDNHGDLGVCWRLSCGLAARAQHVRLWVDDASALAWMAPQGYPGVQVRAWTQPLALSDVCDVFSAPTVATPGQGHVLIEAFGCEVPVEFLSAYASAIQTQRVAATWINLEYLSAQAYVERNHTLCSPVASGPAAGLSKHFFYPGFTPRTGGLLREADLLKRQQRFDRASWLRQMNLGNPEPHERLISLFCYEPAALPALLQQLAHETTPSHLLVTAGRASAAVQRALHQLDTHNRSWNAPGKLRISPLPHLSQADYDHLLWACDLNFVRGEDSVVRALWADKPFVWQIYPQHDQAHHDKLEAFLNMLQAPSTLAQWHRTWNGIGNAALGPLEFSAWATAAHAARQRLLAQPDLVSQLLEFVSSDLRPKSG